MPFVTAALLFPHVSACLRHPAWQWVWCGRAGLCSPRVLSNDSSLLTRARQRDREHLSVAIPTGRAKPASLTHPRHANVAINHSLQSLCALCRHLQFDEALEQYTNVSTVLAKMHFNIGTIRLSQGKHADAIEAFSQVWPSQSLFIWKQHNHTSAHHISLTPLAPSPLLSTVSAFALSSSDVWPCARQLRRMCIEDSTTTFFPTTA